MPPSLLGSRETAADCEVASEKIEGLMQSLELKRHPTKGVRGSGKTRLKHLGVLVDSELMTFAVTPCKAQLVRNMAKSLGQQVRSNQRYLSHLFLRSFCGLFDSLTMALP